MDLVLGVWVVPCGYRSFPAGAVCSLEQAFVPIPDPACDGYGDDTSRSGRHFLSRGSSRRPATLLRNDL